MPSSPADLTPKHVRAARALLAWSQQDLAKGAGIATSTVADFERGQRTPVANNAQAIRAALEAANIRFLPTGAVIGPPIPRIKVADRPGSPVRWVDADDLAHWAGTTDGVVSLPMLVSHLIRATHGPGVTLRFPAAEGVRHPGWDGQTSAEFASAYVPTGEAGWEIGSQRVQIGQKLAADYAKRTADPMSLDPSRSAFIFVTPRHWAQKDAWAKARTLEGPWREVRVYDADDLVHWIEQTPAVGLWLATRLGKRPPGTRELDGLWEEWSLATQWPLPQELVLCDRDEDATDVLRWLRAEPAVLSLQTTTVDEVAAFFYATLGLLPEDIGEAYRRRCLVATDVAGGRALVHAPAPLILILLEPDPGLARSLVDKGHYVLQAYDDRPVPRGEVKRLARPSREGIADALTTVGIAEPRARSLARDSGRNLAILRRLIPTAPGRLPSWAVQAPPTALLAALLAGGWNEDSEADKAKLSELAGQPYAALSSALMPFVGELDKPLRKVGTSWRVASPPDAWMLLAPYLGSAEIDRFEAVAETILASADPRFEMDPNERWMATVQGVRPDYSGLLRHGVGEVLILLALWGERMQGVTAPARRAGTIVNRLLANADQQRWWSLSRYFRLLAEASPKAFLAALDDSLDQADPPLRALFGRDEGGVFGTEHLSDLLWALQSLAWSPDYLGKVSLVLARLDALDSSSSRHGNRPAGGLREIYLLWNPQTFASLGERLRVLDLIRKREPAPAWKLMLGILPTGHDSATPAPYPRWRDFTVDKVETVTWGLIRQGAEAMSSRLVEDVGLDPAKWLLLLDRLADLAPTPEAALQALEGAEPRIDRADDRNALWTALRRLLHHHREFPEAQWRLPDQALARIETIYHRFAPPDPLARIAWLFEMNVPLPNPSREGWEASDADVKAAREAAACALFAERGAEGVLALAGYVETAGFIGRALYEGGVSEPALDRLLEAALRSEDARVRNLAHGQIGAMFPTRKHAWAKALIARASAEAWGETALLTLLRALPSQPSTWAEVANAGPAIEDAYWRKAGAYWISEDPDAVAFAIRKLVKVGRARDALGLTDRAGKHGLASDLIVEVLQEAARQPAQPSEDTNEPVMFQHHVAELLGQLDKRPDVDRGALIALEWAYLPLLEYSQRPVKVLLEALSEQPELFIEMLSAVFGPSEASGLQDSKPDNPKRAQAIATQAYRLLELWDRLPGTLEDGSIDAAALEDWVKQARSRAKAIGREDVADSRIGNMLSASPIGADGHWPHEAVREVLDLFRSKSMLNGFVIGKSNRRGATMRAYNDGGELERREAEKYRRWANAVAFEHPRTAKALETLASRYDLDAQIHDEDVERQDWEI